MKPSREISSADHKLDQLLASRPVTASPGFEAGVLARIREMSADDSLDALLRDHPVQTSPRFMEKTLEAIRAERRERRNLLVFPRIFWWAGAAAAMLVAGFFTNQYFLEPTAVPTITVNDNSSYYFPEVESPDIFVMAEIHALFILADGLSDAEIFLDEGAYATLDTISYDEAVLF